MCCKKVYKVSNLLLICIPFWCVCQKSLYKSLTVIRFKPSIFSALVWLITNQTIGCFCTWSQLLDQVSKLNDACEHPPPSSCGGFKQSVGFLPQRSKAILTACVENLNSVTSFSTVLILLWQVICPCP